MVHSNKTINAIQMIARLIIDEASRAFSKMIRQGVSIEMQNAYFDDISNVTAKICNEYNEYKGSVGAIVDLTGDVKLKFLFMTDLSTAQILTDLLLRRQTGTTKEYDINVESTVQEIGNVLSCIVANMLVNDFQISMTPSVPVVLRDFAGTIFAEFIRDVADERQEALVVESRFLLSNQKMKCHMFIMPVGESEQILQYLTFS
ncbi:MAG: hypothetical protein HQL26_08195 [Candidatus Omnitrophica bacterium]|nr:hypothetical protein [Candidatus Omnitrophota bacterium]